MENKNILIGFAVLAIIGLGGFFFDKSPQVTVIVPENKTPISVGALTNPDLTSPYLSVGGVRVWHERKQFLNATNTVCTYRSPAASTTIERWTAIANVSTSSATIIEFGTSTSPSATTSPISSKTVGAGLKWNHIATSSAGQGSTVAAATATADIVVVPPNTYLNVNVGANYGSADQTGNFCTWSLRELTER